MSKTKKNPSKHLFSSKEKSAFCILEKLWIRIQDPKCNFTVSWDLSSPILLRFLSMYTHPCFLLSYVSLHSYTYNSRAAAGRGPEGIKTSFSPCQILPIFILLPGVASQVFMVMAENILQ